MSDEKRERIRDSLVMDSRRGSRWDDAADLLDEVDRLRAALKAIADYGGLLREAEMARKALGGKSYD
jgi:hypothetical protein